MKFVAIKTVEQLDLQGLHRVRERLVWPRTSVINQIRAFLLGRGIAVRQGLRALRREMPIVLGKTDKLSQRMVHMIEDLCAACVRCAGRKTTPSGTTPCRTNRHRAISNLRAKATIMGLRALLAFCVRARYHCAKALSFWYVKNRHANWIMPRRTRPLPRTGQPFLPAFPAALVG